MEEFSRCSDSIAECLEISAGSAAAVVGCGGKTSLILLLAEKLREKKILISPTTKIFPPKAAHILCRETLEQCAAHAPQKGIQCLGLRLAESGKLGALPETLLAEILPRYDVALLEADGSRGLPCKGWLAGEPVVPPYCTHTIGVLTIQALGEPASAQNVLRLPEFLALTGLREGEPVGINALVSMVCAPGGMFRQSAGGRYLLVNQVESETAAETAHAFLSGIKEKYPGFFRKTLYGSVRLDCWREV